MVDVLSDTLNKIKIYENIGKDQCTVPDTKLVKAVLLALKKSNYVKEIEEIKSGKFPALKVTLSKKINDIGVIKPRHAVALDDYQKYEARYIPSRNFGMLIISTPLGIMSNKEAKEQKTGGRILAFVY